MCIDAGDQEANRIVAFLVTTGRVNRHDDASAVSSIAIG
jgi:hypothetical protein